MARVSKTVSAPCALLEYEDESVVRRFMARRGVTRGEARGLLRELLKLLWLSSRRGVPASYPPILHELWRELVVDTAAYERLCVRHLGGLLHYAPDSVVAPSAKSDRELDSAIGLVVSSLGRETAELWFDTLIRRYPLGWRDYHVATRHASSSTALRGALRRFGPRPANAARRRLAIDLGSGGGRDTRELLARGWRVLAIDAEPSSLTTLLEATGARVREALTLRCARFEQIRSLPRCDLVNASLALPFCPPARFPRFWGVVVAAIRVGGRFVGDFLGNEDPWATRPALTSRSVAQVRELLRDLHVERLDDRRMVGPSASEGDKRWHLISVVAKRRR